MIQWDFNTGSDDCQGLHVHLYVNCDWKVIHVLQNKSILQ